MNYTKLDLDKEHIPLTEGSINPHTVTAHVRTDEQSKQADRCTDWIIIGFESCGSIGLTGLISPNKL